MESRAHNVAWWLGRHDPARPAVADDERTLRYGELDARCARLAGALSAGGVARGARVALLLANRCSYLEAVFACARLGAIAVPLNNRLAPPEIARQLADCTPHALLAEPELAARARTAGGALPPLVWTTEPGGIERALAAASPHEVTPLSPEDPLLIMYTSGTTGTPKGALLPHRKSLFNSLNAQLFFGLTPSDRVLVALPLFHSFGLSILSLPTLYAGGTLVLHRRFDPGRVWKAVEEHGITFFGAVPTMFTRLLDTLPEPRPPSLRFLFTAGAAISVEAIRAYERRGLVLKQGFGQTETSILCCLEARDALRKAGSVGRPVFHAEVRCVHPETFRDVAAGETGEIIVRGPITMLGYWNRPEDSASVFHEGWLRTGDLASVDDEGFFTLVGRAREMYISGGENVYPAEVEAVLETHPDVAEIAVVGIPDAEWGEVGKAFVVPAAEREVDFSALREWARERLASFKIPHEFQLVAELPRTETGKVQRHRLTQSS